MVNLMGRVAYVYLWHRAKRNLESGLYVRADLRDLDYTENELDEWAGLIREETNNPYHAIAMAEQMLGVSRDMAKAMFGLFYTSSAIAP
jgi:hypothetical protein